MPLVTHVRAELKEALKRYDIIRDCLGGEIAVKSKGSTYLPVPRAGESDADVSSRYAAYKARAVFYNATKRTLDGLCGQIFVRDPVVTLPSDLNALMADADGGGVALTQLAKEGVQYTLGFGRAGLFVDYPAVAGAVTEAQVQSGEVRPTLRLYEPWAVINWRTTSRGARNILSLVVLEETYLKQDDGYAAVEGKRWRVLKLENDEYVVEVWTDKGGTKGRPEETFYPTDAAGNRLTEIPFTFIGCKNNDHVVDEPPMYDIATLNIAHYRNSADYEESVFMVGQPTPVLSGLTEDWVRNVLNGKVLLGSRGAIVLPEGGTATLLQAGANTLAFEAMQHKEKQMVALGARLVEQRSVTRTATETNKDATTESSVLASAAKNVSAAFTRALQWAATFTRGAGDNILFSLNTDFDIATMTSEERRQLLSEWQSGGISWTEYRTNLRKSGIATLKDDVARDLIDEELAASLERDMAATLNTETANASAA